MCVCVCVCMVVVVGGGWWIRPVWTILSIWFNWFVECAGACDSVQQMAFHRSESWHSSIDNEQSCICWDAKVPSVKAGYGLNMSARLWSVIKAQVLRCLLYLCRGRSAANVVICTCARCVCPTRASVKPLSWWGFTGGSCFCLIRQSREGTFNWGREKPGQTLLYLKYLMLWDSAVIAPAR